MIIVGQEHIAHHVVAVFPSVKSQVLNKDFAVSLDSEHWDATVGGPRNEKPAVGGGFVSSLHSEGTGDPAAGAAGLSGGGFSLSSNRRPSLVHAPNSLGWR